ncbi:hypothetical protein HY546_02440 [archaeon]|nr:hypothetical protein [archaeon]
MFFPKFRGSNYASLFFWIIILAVALVHAHSSPNLRQAEQLVNTTIGAAWTPYTGSILALIETQLLIPYATLSFDPGLIALPPFFVYYLAAITGGILAGLIALRGERKFVDALLSPIATTVHLLIGLFILALAASTIIGSIQNAVKSLPLPAGTENLLQIPAVPPHAYILAFLFTYAAFAAGMLTAACIRHLLEGSKTTNPAA